MKANYARCLSIVLGYEGGYSDHPDDPGGATMRGVTQRTYDSHRLGQGLQPQPVKLIDEGELQAIYRTGYWDVIRGDDLPAGVDLAVFDYAVNSGPARAAKGLQAIVGADTDGRVGPATLAAVRALTASDIVTTLCSRRLEFLQGLSTWTTFRRGWQTRVRGIEASALAMVDAPVPVAPIPPRPPPRGPLNTTGAPVGPTTGLWALIVSLVRWIFGKGKS